MNDKKITEQDNNVLKQKDWSSSQLRQEGFQRFTRKKQIVLARRVTDAEVPKHILTSQGDELVANKNYMICYIAGEKVFTSLDSYEQWPVEPDIFKHTYRYWDEAFQPTPAEQYLMQHGCQPYYKFANVWAKELTEDTYYQSLEHDEPVKAEVGEIMAIGAEGEPYSMGNDTFFNRYQVDGIDDVSSARKRSWINRLVDFFKGDG